MGGLFLECDVTLFNKSIFIPFCLKMASLALFEHRFGSKSINNFSILNGCHLMPKRYSRYFIAKVEKDPIEILNLMSHTLGYVGNIEFVMKYDRGWVGV